jgi:hypothetical protein
MSDSDLEIMRFDLRSWSMWGIHFAAYIVYVLTPLVRLNNSAAASPMVELIWLGVLICHAVYVSLYHVRSNSGGENGF